MLKRSNAGAPWDAVVRPNQVWSMSSGFGGARVQFRIVSVDGDEVVTEGRFRGQVRRRLVSARALVRGVRASRLEVDENGKAIEVQPRDAAVLRLKAKGMSNDEMARSVGVSVESVRRTLSRARARQAGRGQGVA